MQASAREQDSKREAFRLADSQAEARESANMLADAARLDAQVWAREAQRKQAIRDVGRANLDAITAKREASKLTKQQEREEEVSVRIESDPLATPRTGAAPLACSHSTACRLHPSPKIRDAAPDAGLA